MGELRKYRKNNYHLYYIIKTQNYKPEYLMPFVRERERNVSGYEHRHRKASDLFAVWAK